MRDLGASELSFRYQSEADCGMVVVNQGPSHSGQQAKSVIDVFHQSGFHSTSLSAQEILSYTSHASVNSMRNPRHLLIALFKTTFPFLLACSLGYAASCPAGQAKSPEALVQIEHVWLQAAEQHDVAGLGCILADEFEEADFAGSLIDRRAMLANVAKRDDVHFELSELHAHVYGDAGYVRGVGMRSDNHRPTTRFTDIFVYRDGRWQCVAGHESRFPEVR